MTHSPDISLDAPLDELLDAARARYDVVFEPVNAAGRTLEILQLADMSGYVEQIADAAGKDETIELPFWAKIWPASMILSHMLAAQQDIAGKTVLEIGAGVGVCGLFAAACGYETLITDIHPDALLFAQINVLHNGLADHASVARADFAEDRLGRRFDYVVGAEVLYIEKLHRGLVKFLSAHVKAEPGAEAILARDYFRKSSRFFKLADKDFRIMCKTLGCKTQEQDDDEERYLCDLVRLQPRKQVKA